MKVHQRIKALREDRDLTQKQAAQIGCISKKTYERYENGERIPPLDTIKLFADYYNTSIDYIAYSTNIKIPYEKIKVNDDF